MEDETTEETQITDDDELRRQEAEEADESDEDDAEDEADGDEEAVDEDEDEEAEDEEGEGDEDGEDDGEGRDIPRAAYHRLKDEVKALRDSNDNLQQQLQAAVAAPVQIQDDPNDPEPDAEDDPIGHIQWQKRSMARFQQAIVTQQRTAFVASQEAIFAAREGADWTRRVTMFQRLVARNPSNYDVVFGASNPAQALVDLTNDLGFTPSATAVAPAKPKAKVKTTTQPHRQPAEPSLPRTLRGAKGARPEVPFDADRDYTAGQLDRMTPAQRRKWLSGR